MIPAGNSDDEADASMVTPKKVRLHRPTFGSILVLFYLFGGLVSPRHSESAPRNNGSRYHFGTIKVETRTQLLMPTQARTGDDRRETVGDANWLLKGLRLELKSSTNMRTRSPSLGQSLRTRC